MKYLFIILFSISLMLGQTIKPLTNEVKEDTSFVKFIDEDNVYSSEELFLKEISDKALAKEEKKKKVTNKVLTIMVVILLVDKFIK